MNREGLVLAEVRLSVAQRQLLAVDCTILPGEITTVMGPSGSGKSSLLAAVSGLLGQDFSAEGEVWLNGECLNGLPAEARRIGLLFQDPLLYPHLSVAENLGFGLAPTKGERRSDRAAKISGALSRIGLQGFENRDPATLSGGQQSRVALMRLLLSEPRAVLLDEPFSALDAQLQDEIRELTFASIRAAKIPALLVSHDSRDARAAGGPLISL